MIVLDSDHLSVLAFAEDRRHQNLSARLLGSDEAIRMTIVSLEEELRGWLAYVSRQRKNDGLIKAYERLQRSWSFFRTWTILPFDHGAATALVHLRSQKIRIGTQDFKIASIAMTHDALLLSANLRDFRQVPGLRVENWLEP